jgi:transcriptional regulator with XRE-family HTH domain
MGFDIGERLRLLREKHGLSQRALAKQANVTNGIICLIEQNRTSPSVGTLKKILDGIPISLAEFFTIDPETDTKIVYQASELIEIGSQGISYRQVGSNLQGMAMQILHEHLDPGADSGTDMLSHEAEEGGIVIQGTLELTVDAKEYILKAGDAYYFDSRLPHRFRNIGEGVCEIISACTPPSV